MNVIKSILAISLVLSSGAFADGAVTLDQCAAAFAQKSKRYSAINRATEVALASSGAISVGAHYLHWPKPVMDAAILTATAAGVTVANTISHPYFFSKLSEALAEVSQGAPGQGVHSLTEYANVEIFDYFGIDIWAGKYFAQRSFALMRKLSFKPLRDKETFTALQKMYDSGLLCKSAGKTSGHNQFFRNLVSTVARMDNE